jgi:hypothetical protein
MDELCLTGMFCTPLSMDGRMMQSVMLANIAHEPMLSDALLVEQRANNRVKK